MNSLQNRSTLLDKQYDTGQFSACIVTNIGKEMIAKSQNGQTLTFTRVALGDGLIDDDDDILSFTKVKNERLSANIAKWVDKQNGQFQIQFRVSNQEVEIGFWQREIGIMAKIDGGEEQLYAYATSGNGADFLYDKTTPIDERIVNIDFVIGNAENVQVIVNGSIIYATIEDLENAIDEHNTDENAHDNLIKRLFGSAEATLDSIKLKIKEWAKEVCLPLSGGTMKGNINANGYNITATKFIGNLQGKADSAANADLAAKATTAENANNANNSSVANKLGTSTVGSATKPVYINNGVASAVSVDLSTLAPKASPGLTGTPTAPTVNVDTNNTQIATCGFVRNAIAKFAPMLDTMKKIYPVGSIYMSTVSTNPATLFGFGTWEAMPAGRVLLAQGKSSWGTTYNAGSTVGELPSHGHSASTNNVNQNGNIGWLQAGKDYDFSGVFATSYKNHGANVGNGESTGVWNCIFDSTHSHNVTINNTGSNQSHNNLQPYISVYIWKRTA
ncbi:phage baseplate protein [Megamonas funiformis]|uniref:phage baseplate protein n=1 Tax=Megamonas funiformis TaxID=437897 RepID=UPI00399439BA